MAENKSPVQGQVALKGTLAGTEDWDDEQIDFGTYKAEECNHETVRGVLVGIVRMPDAPPRVAGGPSREWWTYLVRLTHPCPVLDAERKITMEEPGRIVQVPIGQLLDRLERYATHPDYMVEVAMTPGKKEKLAGGKTRQLWDVKINKKAPIKRTSADKFFLSPQNVVKALPAPSASNGTAGAQDAIDEFPG